MIPGSANSLLLRSAAPATYQVQRSIRLNAPDSAYLSRTPASAGNRKTFTFACWIKRAKLDVNYQSIFSANASGGNGDLISFGNDNSIRLWINGGTSGDLKTTQVFRDVSAWYHFVYAIDTTQATSSNRIKLYVNGSQVTSFATASYPTQNYDFGSINTAIAHEIGRGYSAQFDGLLADIHFCDGTAYDASAFGEFDATTGVWNPKKFTGSYGSQGWKLDFADNSNNTATTLGKDTSGNGLNWTPNNLIAFSGGNTNYSTLGSVSTSGTTVGAIANAYDGSPADGAATSGTPWGVIAGTNTQSGLSIAFTSQVKVYYNVNTTGGTISINGNSKSAPVPTNGNTTIGTLTWTTSDISSPFTSLSFTSPNGGVGVYVYGVEVDGSMLIDYSVRGRDLDSLVDSPTHYGTDTGAGGEVRGNYCTLNPLSTSSGTYSQGNLRFVGASNWMNSNGTIAVSTGKWYYEVTVANAPYSPRSSSSEYNGFGWAVSNVQAATTTPRTQSDAVMYGDNGYYKNFTGSNTDGGAVSSGDVLAIAVDLDANTFYLYKNNSQIATGTIGGTAGRELTPRISSYNGSYGALDVNFGQRPFAYTAPSGYKALCTANLPAPTIVKPSTVMDVLAYSGSGSSRTFTGFNFGPDLVWIKQRSGANNHRLYDAVRGATKALYPNLTNSEGTDSAGLTSFTSDGFTLGDGDQVWNASGSTYVAWTWDGGSSTVTNTSGSITGTVSVRANATAGFSVVTYTGTGANATVGHGLGVAPGFIIIKNRSSATNWRVYHSALGNTKVIFLSTTGAPDTNSVYWNNTSPTSTVFSVGSDDGVNGNGNSMVAYCFAPVSGYSSFGSYTGNGSADGPFVYTGFRPKWIIIKVTNISGESWVMKDSVRGSYNPQDANLYADLSAAEQTANSTRYLDLLSNGFKWRGTEVSVNGNGNTYIYAAFAESPLNYSRAR